MAVIESTYRYYFVDAAENVAKISSVGTGTGRIELFQLVDEANGNTFAGAVFLHITFLIPY